MLLHPAATLDSQITFNDKVTPPMVGPVVSADGGGVVPPPPGFGGVVGVEPERVVLVVVVADSVGAAHRAVGAHHHVDGVDLDHCGIAVPTEDVGLVERYAESGAGGDECGGHDRDHERDRPSVPVQSAPL